MGLLSCKEKNKYLDHVGDLAFNAKIDNKDFLPCSEKFILQYYNFGENIQYNGEKRAIINTFKQNYKPVKSKENVYVTIRFIVNCDGKTGRFRVKTMDMDYNAIVVDKNITNQLLSITKSLNGWKQGIRDGVHFDYYQYLTFKITNGAIESILP